MDVTREYISRILEMELREILLSVQTGFNLVNAAVVCAILESISGFEQQMCQQKCENTFIIFRIDYGLLLRHLYSSQLHGSIPFSSE